MITRYESSKFRNGIRVAFCAALGVSALASAPRSIAQDNFDGRITISVIDMDLRMIVTLLSNFSGANIVISDQLPKVGVTFEADSVPVRVLLNDVLRCAGAEMVQPSSSVIEIRPAAETGLRECRDIEITERPTTA